MPRANTKHIIEEGTEPASPKLVLLSSVPVNALHSYKVWIEGNGWQGSEFKEGFTEEMIAEAVDLLLKNGFQVQRNAYTMDFYPANTITKITVQKLP